MSVRKNYI